MCLFFRFFFPSLAISSKKTFLGFTPPTSADFGCGSCAFNAHQTINDTLSSFFSLTPYPPYPGDYFGSFLFPLSFNSFCTQRNLADSFPCAGCCLRRFQCSRPRRKKRRLLHRDSAPRIGSQRGGLTVTALMLFFKLRGGCSRVIRFVLLGLAGLANTPASSCSVQVQSWCGCCLWSFLFVGDDGWFWVVAM